MAQPFEQTQTRTLVQPQGSVHFELNEEKPDQSTLCDNNSCRQISPAQFQKEYPLEYAQYLQSHKEMEKLRDPNGTALEPFPRIGVGPDNPSVRQLRLDPSSRLQLDPSGRLQLDPSGRLQFDQSGRLQFDSAPPLQLDSSGRLQLRGRGNGNDLLRYGRNGADPADPADPFGQYGSQNDRYGYSRRNNGLDTLLDPFGQGRRGNGLDALLDPFGQRRRNGLDALLDPFGQNRRLGPYGYDSLNNPNSPYRLPGRGRLGNELPLDFGSPDQLQLLYQPPAVEKPVQKTPVQPPKPLEQLQPVQQPVEQPTPLEQPKQTKPGQPIDGPKPPTDLEPRQTPADVAANQTDQMVVRDAFDQSVKDTGAFTIKNFGEAYREAAKAGAGVAIMVVGRDIPGSEEALKNVKKLQEENPKLKFLVVDRDQVDAAVKADPANAKMKEWQNWIDTSLKACSKDGQTGGVLTSVQSLKADSTGFPVPEKVTSYHWNRDVNQELAAKASLASDATVAHAGEFRLTMNSESAKTLASQITAARQEALDTPVTDLNSVRARQEKLTRAIQMSSQARPDLLAQRRKEIDAIPDEAVRNQEMAVLNLLQNAPLQLRAELGLDMARSVADMPTPAKKTAMSVAALEVLRDAYNSAPELKNNPQFADALKAGGVNVDQLIKESDNAPRVSADQLKDRLDNVYKSGDPIRVTEKRTEYVGNVTPEARGLVNTPQYRQQSYSQCNVSQNCGRPGGFLRNLICGGGRGRGRK